MSEKTMEDYQWICYKALEVLRENISVDTIPDGPLLMDIKHMANPLGTKQFEVSCLDEDISDKYVGDIIVRMVELINKLDGVWRCVKPVVVSDTLCVAFEDKGVSIRLIKQYDTEIKKAVVHFDIQLVRVR